MAGISAALLPSFRRHLLLFDDKKGDYMKGNRWEVVKRGELCQLFRFFSSPVSSCVFPFFLSFLFRPPPHFPSLFFPPSFFLIRPSRVFLLPFLSKTAWRSGREGRETSEIRRKKEKSKNGGSEGQERGDGRREQTATQKT